MKQIKLTQTAKITRIFKLAILSLSLCGLLGLTGATYFRSEVVSSQTENQSRLIPKQIFGLTVDNVSDLDEVINQLKFFKSQNPDSIKPMVRVVFDANEDYPQGFDETYLCAIRRMKQEADVSIMGEIMDSFSMNNCIVRKSDESNAEIDREKSKKCYADRTRNYLDKLGDLVDVWEIGNEVNGEWAGWSKDENGNDEWEKDEVTADDMKDVRDIIKEQVHAAYQILKGKKTALTFYFNDDNSGKTTYPDKKDGCRRKNKNDKTKICFGSEYGMFEWSKDYAEKFPEDEINYIFISYYQDDNWFEKKQIVPDAAGWAQIFNRLRNQTPFRNSEIGFGEVGAQCYYGNEPTNTCIPFDSDENINRECSCCLWAQTEYANRYYLTWDANIRQELIKIDRSLADKYVGGYFWWHFNDDVINKFTSAKNANLPENVRKNLKEEGEKTRTTLVNILRRWRGETVSTNLFSYNSEEFAANQMTTKILQPGDTSKEKPYTIVIINNPAYLEDDEIIADPINNKPEKFAESVNYIYANLFGNLPHQAEKFLAAFSDKIRVIAIYAPNMPIDESHTFVEIDGQLVARQDVLAAFLAQMNLTPDVVFTVSDHPEIMKATAWRAIDDENGGGVDFTLNTQSFKHFYQTKTAGAAAIHANNRSMTALHEFGHAASSETQGYVADLYNNRMNEKFVVNKKSDKKYKREIPPLFCVYNNFPFKTDNYRDKEARKTIHAERIDPRFPALMDNYTIAENGFPEQSQHDKLTRQFLIDHIKAKTER